jgi:hypothetical protein
MLHRCSDSAILTPPALICHTARHLNHCARRSSTRVRGANEALIYGNFSDPKGGRVYQEISDHAALVKVMEEYLEDHNAMTNKPMSLVLFQVRDPHDDVSPITVVERRTTVCLPL